MLVLLHCLVIEEQFFKPECEDLSLQLHDNKGLLAFEVFYFRLCQHNIHS